MARLAAVITRIHRIAAIVILLAIPPAWWASARGGEPAALVYAPLAPLFVLIITGTYQLVAPWVRRVRAGRST